ncbi:MAG: hypothetical protein NPIRA02_29570 [Nitrospirales bacterium]|nr:MAG: hypothetical protein NPIRA02_29570 [Nitrospirales bacterium]
MIDYTADAKSMIEALDYEEIWYCPDKLPPRKIHVLIERNPPELDFGFDANSAKSVRRVHIVRHAVHGVEVPQYGKDQVHLKDNRWDHQDTVFRVQNEVHQDDPGLIVVDVVR